MTYVEVITGHQTWRDYVTTREQIRSFDNAVKTAGGRVELAVSDMQIALQGGLGAVGDTINVASERLADRIELGLEQLAGGLDRLNADFNLLLGDVIWKLEIQNAALSSVVQLLQAPLDTAGKELRRRAEHAYQNGWYEEALQDLLASAHLNYQDFAVHRTLGQIYLYHLVDVDKAIESFLAAAKYARPRDAQQAAEALFFAGLACAIRLEHRQALLHLHEVLRLNPHLYEAAYLAAQVSTIIGDADAALGSLRTAILGDPRYLVRAQQDPAFAPIAAAKNDLLANLNRAARIEAHAAFCQLDEQLAEALRLIDQYTTAYPEKRKEVLAFFTPVGELRNRLQSYLGTDGYIDLRTVMDQAPSGLALCHAACSQAIKCLIQHLRRLEEQARVAMQQELLEASRDMSDDHSPPWGCAGLAVVTLLIILLVQDNEMTEPQGWLFALLVWGAALFVAIRKDVAKRSEAERRQQQIRAGCEAKSRFLHQDILELEQSFNKR